METAVTSVERTLSRKIRMTTTAIARPSRPSVVRLLIERSTNGAWSVITVSLAPESFSRSASMSRTLWEISTGLPSGRAVTAMPRLS